MIQDARAALYAGDVGLVEKKRSAHTNDKRDEKRDAGTHEYAGEATPPPYTGDATPPYAGDAP